MIKNDQKWSKFNKNDQKMIKNNQKWSKNHKIQSRETHVIFKNLKVRFFLILKSVKNDQKWSKMIKNDQKRSQNGQKNV